MSMNREEVEPRERGWRARAHRDEVSSPRRFDNEPSYSDISILRNAVLSSLCACPFGFLRFSGRFGERSRSPFETPRAHAGDSSRARENRRDRSRARAPDASAVVIRVAPCAASRCASQAHRENRIVFPRPYGSALTALRSSWIWAALATVRPATIVLSVYVGNALPSFV